MVNYATSFSTLKAGDGGSSKKGRGAPVVQSRGEMVVLIE